MWCRFSEKCTFKTSQRKLLRFCNQDKVLRFHSLRSNNFLLTVRMRTNIVYMYKKNATQCDSPYMKEKHSSWSGSSQNLLYVFWSRFHYLTLPSQNPCSTGWKTNWGTTSRYLYLHIDQPEIIERMYI
jgi:hypothetical protein